MHNVWHTVAALSRYQISKICRLKWQESFAVVHNAFGAHCTVHTQTAFFWGGGRGKAKPYTCVLALADSRLKCRVKNGLVLTCGLDQKFLKASTRISRVKLIEKGCNKQIALPTIRGRVLTQIEWMVFFYFIKCQDREFRRFGNTGVLLLIRKTKKWLELTWRSLSPLEMIKLTAPTNAPNVDWKFIDDWCIVYCYTYSFCHTTQYHCKLQ